ncbi:hypothetical protein J6590_093542 [Homalodisca vitripennis]|nr:hypothetical protein J6590_093542 [Homalodisca vitripennis]
MITLNKSESLCFYHSSLSGYTTIPSPSLRPFTPPSPLIYIPPPLLSLTKENLIIQQTVLTNKQQKTSMESYRPLSGIPNRFLRRTTTSMNCGIDRLRTGKKHIGYFLSRFRFRIPPHWSLKVTEIPKIFIWRNLEKERFKFGYRTSVDFVLTQPTAKRLPVGTTRYAGVGAAVWKRKLQGFVRRKAQRLIPSPLHLTDNGKPPGLVTTEEKLCLFRSKTS